MSAVCYRLRRPLWLWAIIGPVAAGFPAAIVAGVLLIVFMEDVLPVLRYGFSFSISWYMIWPSGVAFSILLGLPAILFIGIVSMLVFRKVQGRSASRRADVFRGYEKYGWIFLAVSPVLYVFLLLLVLFERAGHFKENVDTELSHTDLFLRMLRQDLPGMGTALLILLPVTLIAGAIARPIFFRIVTKKVRDGCDGVRA